MRPEAVEQGRGEPPLGGAERVGVPFGAVLVLGGHERGLAAHGEAHVHALEIDVHGVAQGGDRLPLGVGIRLGDARRLVDPLYRHQVLEGDLAVVHRAAERGRAGRLGRAGERNMSLAGEQARGRVQSHPARARQIDLAPGVQIREVLVGAGWTVERLRVGGELDQVPRDEARGETEMAEELDEEPGGVTARAAAERERLLFGLHPGIEADHVLDVALHPLIDLDEEVDSPPSVATDGAEIAGEARGQRLGGEVRRQLPRLPVVVREGDVLGGRLQEEVEGVVHRHLGHQVDLDPELPHHVGEDEPRQVVALGILLPVDEVLAGSHAQRIGQDGRAAVRRRAQPHELRRQMDPPVIAIRRHVVEGDMNRHDRPLPYTMHERATRATNG